jgi:O-antigen/teichoic acid export membrane protein
MDFGLASVLKTKIPELQHTGNVGLINAYIKSTYKTCLVIALGIFLFFALIFTLLDVKTFLNISFESSFVTKLFLVNVFFFCVNFILNTHKSLFVGVHKGKYAEQSIAVNQIVLLFFLFIPRFFFKSFDDESKLYLISCINGFVGLFINLTYSYIFFKSEKLNLFTKEKTPKKYLKGIYSLGLKYMLIQVGMLFLFSSDNYILAYFLGPKEIVNYEIVSKYFQFPLMILTSGMSPLWSLFAKHYLEKDKLWLKMCFKKFNYFYILILVGMFLSVVLATPIMKIWISKNFQVSSVLLISVSIMISLRIFTTFYSYFFNGIGNLKSYLFLLLISVILKIPLSFLFIKLNFGISSVVLSSICCLLMWSIIQPLEAYKIVGAIKNNNKNEN